MGFELFCETMEMTVKLKTLNLCVSILLGTISVQACESVAASDVVQPNDVSALLSNPEQARKYDYCYWAFQQGGKSLSLPDYEAQLDRKTTTLSPDALRATSLVNAGTRVAQNAKTQKSCAKTFAKGTRNFEKKLKKSRASHLKQATYEKSEDPKIAAVQEMMAKLWVDDQAARRVYLATRTDDKTGAAYWARRLAGTETAKSDANSTRYMTKLLDEYDWVDSHRFGERVALGAWLMVQHADDHVELQKRALGRMETYLDNGGVDKGNYAYLWDRVAVNSGQKQRYGTQPTWECTDEGNLTLQPLEDPDNVNARRAEMGLDTVEVGLAEMARSVCG